MRQSTSGRGFRRFEMTDTYGCLFKITQSSVALIDAVWINGAHIKIDDLPSVIGALQSFLPSCESEGGEA